MESKSAFLLARTNRRIPAISQYQVKDILKHYSFTLYLMQRQDGMTRHHLIAKYRGGQWDKSNIIPLHEVPHRAWHILFDNDLPIEILRGMTEAVKPSLTQDTYQLINGVLREVEGTLEAYNPKCYDKDRLSHYFKRKGK